MNSSVKQMGGSLDDFISRARREFEAQFNKNKPPEQWMWVRDVFEHHIIIRDKDQHWQIGMQVKAEGITFDARTSWKKVAMDYVMQMAGDDHRSPVTEFFVTEFKGKPPEVPVADEITTALKEIDPEPFFLTMEISRAGAVSKSGLEHDDSLVDTLVTEITGSVRTGIMGHLKDKDRTTAYPVPDIYWVGAIRQGGSAWAKGYIPQSKADVRGHYKVLKATNGQAATSIYGAAVKQIANKDKGTHRLKEFRLEQIDLAPVERAALPLDSSWTITAQMNDEMEGHDMTKEELIAQLSAADVTQAVREQIIREFQAGQGEANRVQELETQNAGLVAELAQFRVAQFTSGLETQIAEMVVFEASTDPAKAKLAALRSTVRRAVLAELAGVQDLAQAKVKIAEYVGSEEYKALSAAVVSELAGPRAAVGGSAQKNQNWRDDLASKAGDLKKQQGV